MKLFAPYINDISTDLDNPPPLSHGKPLPERFKAKIRKHYKEVQPLFVPVGTQETFASALKLITAQSPDFELDTADEATGLIQAHAVTTVGFVDDFCIRVSADGEGSRVDMRSKSRLGRSDFGKNAERIKSVLSRLRTNLQ